MQLTSMPVIAPQPSARFGATASHGDAHPLAPGVVGELVLADPAEPEVAGLGMPEVEARHRRRREHRADLREADASPRLGIEEREDRPLLGVVRTGWIAWRRPDPLVALGDERVVVQRLIGRVAPEPPADLLVEPLGEGLGEPVGEGLGQDGRVVVVGRLEPGDELVEPWPAVTANALRWSRRRCRRAR
jgi:hypothetical protein